MKFGFQLSIRNLGFAVGGLGFGVEGAEHTLENELVKRDALMTTRMA